MTLASRSNACPECGESCTAHTGSYCHACGEPLGDEAARAFVAAYAERVGGTVVESEHFYTVEPKDAK